MTLVEGLARISHFGPQTRFGARSSWAPSVLLYHSGSSTLEIVILRSIEAFSARLRVNDSGRSLTSLNLLSHNWRRCRRQSLPPIYAKNGQPQIGRVVTRLLPIPVACPYRHSLGHHCEAMTQSEQFMFSARSPEFYQEPRHLKVTIVKNTASYQIPGRNAYT